MLCQWFVLGLKNKIKVLLLLLLCLKSTNEAKKVFGLIVSFFRYFVQLIIEENNDINSLTKIKSSMIYGTAVTQQE
jgi:hypothetical protein